MRERKKGEQNETEKNAAGEPGRQRKRELSFLMKIMVSLHQQLQILFDDSHEKGDEMPERVGRKVTGE